jgi:hypothetical protein
MRCIYSSCQLDASFQNKFCSHKHKSAYYANERRRKLKAMAIEYLGGSCIICNYNKCPDAMAFHHRNPATKEFQISDGQTRSWDRTRAELDKCVLLCVRCHAEVHAGVTLLPAFELQRHLRSPEQS